MVKKGACILLLLCAACMLWFFTPKLSGTPALHLAQSPTDTGVRTDYLDDDGGLHTNPAVGYATCLKTLDAQGHTIKEEYLDSKGKPAKVAAGYCGIAREYNALGQCISVTYLDSKGRPTAATYGYAKIIRSFNDRGYIDCQRYYSPSGRSAQDWTGAYGFSRSYDALGRVSGILYLDAAGQPSACTLGYAQVRYTYNEKWLRQTESYFDSLGQPTQSRDGAYAIGYTYDEDNRTASRTALDAQGQPMAQAGGYAREDYTYASDGSLVKTAYFAPDGSAALVQGRYHIVSYEGGRRYYDLLGKEVILPEEYLKSHLGFVALAAALLCAGALWLPRSACAGLTILYILFICYMTLGNRLPGGPMPVQALFASYRHFLSNSAIRRQILGNIALFIPLGALLGRLSRKGRSWMIFLLLTAAVELVQLATGLGRFDADDIFSNVLGGFLGWGLVRLYCGWLRSGKAR